MVANEKSRNFRLKSVQISIKNKVAYLFHFHKMKTIKIAGVPEHFNLPWQLCIEKGEFLNENINLEWTNVPEGTGKLCQMLRDGATDIAIILTEGIFKDIIAGNDSSIVQKFVESPLLWGIHVDAKSSFDTLSDLQNKKAAISRLGSGSHLMSIVNASNQNWDLQNLEYVIVNTIDGAVEALTNSQADYFMWEHFMTKPLVDIGVFRRIADCSTPWPSFVIAIQNKTLQSQPQTIAKILEIINEKTRHFKNIDAIETILADRYNLKTEDCQTWLSKTTWSQHNLNEKAFEKIQNQLLAFKIIDKKTTFAKLIKVL